MSTYLVRALLFCSFARIVFAHISSCSVAKRREAPYHLHPWHPIPRERRVTMLHLRCRCTHRKPLTEEFASVILMSVRVVQSGLDAVSVWWVYLSVSLPGGTSCVSSICRRWCLSSHGMLVMNTIWNSMELSFLVYLLLLLYNLLLQNSSSLP